MTDLIAQMQKAMADLEAMNDDLLLAIAHVAAAGRFQIIPHKPAMFGADMKPIMVLPQRMYDRMLEVAAKEAKP